MNVYEWKEKKKGGLNIFEPKMKEKESRANCEGLIFALIVEKKKEKKEMIHLMIHAIQANSYNRPVCDATRHYYDLGLV